MLAKGLKPEQVKVDIQARHLAVSISDAEGQEDYSLDVPLAGAVVPEDSRLSVLSTKVEVRLKKAQPGEQWPALEAAAGPPAAPLPSVAMPAPAEPLAIPLPCAG